MFKPLKILKEMNIPVKYANLIAFIPEKQSQLEENKFYLSVFISYSIIRQSTKINTVNEGVSILNY